MFTKADKQFLTNAFASKDDIKQMREEMKNFATKGEIKDQIKDLREQISDDMDGKLKLQKEATVTEVGEYIVDTLVPMFDERDRKIARLEMNAGLAPLAD